MGWPNFDRPSMLILVPIPVPHEHDDIVNVLHDHLLLDEAFPIDPLGHRWKVLLS